MNVQPTTKYLQHSKMMTFIPKCFKCVFSNQKEKKKALILLQTDDDKTNKKYIPYRSRFDKDGELSNLTKQEMILAKYYTQKRQNKKKPLDDDDDIVFQNNPLRQ